MTARRPGISGIGHVTDDGTTIVISGWALGLCAANCNCHRHPITGQLSVLDMSGTVAGPRHPALGLARYGGPCDCCQPWTADELRAVIRDLADITTLETA